jgi:hypothetical protein
MLYRLHSLVIASSSPLPELPEVAEATVDLTFQMLPPKELQDLPARWDHHQPRPDGQILRSFARLDDCDFVHFPGYADFLLSKDCKQIRCYPRPGVPAETVRHIFLDLVMPLVLSRRGDVVLHGSAVASDDGAIAFLGQSGSGKSTLAASFAGAGFRLLADDTVLLREDGEDLRVVPSYPGLRLWPSTVASLMGNVSNLDWVAHDLPKHRVGPEHGQFVFISDHLPLLRIYVVDKTPHAICSLAPLTARDACLHLVRNTISLDHDCPEVLRAQFETNTRLARRPIFRHLSYPRDFAALPEVQRLVQQDLRDGG